MKRSRIESLKIKGYKSIRDTELVFDQNLKVFIGANGSGKSNILSYFELLNYMKTNGLRIRVGQEGGANRLLHYSSEITPYLGSELIFKTEAGYNLYAMELEANKSDGFYFKREEISFSYTLKELNERRNDLGVGHFETKLNVEDHYSTYVDTTRNVISNLMSRWRFFQFHNTESTAHIRTNCDVSQNSYLFSNAGNLAAYLYRLKEQHSFEYQRIIGVIRQMLPGFWDFVLEPSGNYISLEWYDESRNYVFSGNQLSDGSIRLVAITTLLLQPSGLMPDLICLDEPELGLHPAAINMLAEMLKIASKETQIMVATQSPLLLRNLALDEIAIVERVRSTADPNKYESRIIQPKEEELKEWLQDYTLDELWEMNVLGGRP